MKLNEYVELMKPFSTCIELCNLGLLKVVVCYGRVFIEQLGYTTTNCMLFDKDENAIGLWSIDFSEKFEKVLYKRDQ